MQLDEIIDFQIIFNKATPLHNDSTLNNLKGCLSNAVLYFKKNPFQLELNNRLKEFTDKGWDSNWIVSEVKVKNRYSLLQCLDKNDVITEINTDYIKITKASGEEQYYEKDLRKSMDRSGKYKEC